MSTTISKPGSIYGMPIFNPTNATLKQFKGPAIKDREMSKCFKDWEIYLKNLKTTWNSYAENTECPLRISVDIACKKLRSLQKNPGESSRYLWVARNIYCGMDIGQLFDTQIRTIIDTLNAGLQSTHIIILGVMQVGKSMTTICLSYLEPLFAYLLGERVESIYCAPNRNNITTQHAEAATFFKEIHTDIVFYLEKEGKEKKKTFGTFIFEKMMSKDSISNHNDAIHPNSVHKITDFHKKIKKFREQGMRVLVYYDECHYGTGTDGVSDKNISPFRDEMRKQDPDILWRSISATPYEHIGLIDHVQIKHWISEGYYGPNFIAKQKMPIIKGVISHPKLECLADLGYNEEALNQTFYSNETKFANHFGIDPTSSSRKHRIYQKKYAEILCDIFIKKIKNGSTKDRGIMMRPARKNDYLKLLAKDMNSYLKEKGYEKNTIVFSQCGKEADKDDTIKNIIAKKSNSHLDYCIMFTGGARMSVQFPDHCTHFLDLTMKFSNLASEQQGTYGRACGWNKATTVILRKSVYSSLKDSIKSQGLPAGRTMSSRVERVPGSARGPKGVQLAWLYSDYIEELGHTNISQMFTEIAEIMKYYVSPNNKRILKKSLNGENRLVSDTKIAEILDKYNFWEWARNNSDAFLCPNGTYSLLDVDPTQIIPGTFSKSKWHIIRKKIKDAKKGISSPYISEKIAKSGEQKGCMQYRGVNGIGYRKWKYDKDNSAFGARSVTPTLSNQTTIRTNPDGGTEFEVPQIMITDVDEKGKLLTKAKIIAAIFPLRYSALKHISLINIDEIDTPRPKDTSMFYEHDENYEG